MAALITTDFQIPNDIAAEIFKKAQGGSVLAKLSGARPQKFGPQTTWVLTAPPKAEIVGEGAEKSPTPTTYAPKVIKPFKTQVTMRFSQEVQWADEDTQIGVLRDLAENAGSALGRALDLAGIHKLNPLTGTTSSIITEGIADTSQKVHFTAGSSYPELVESAAATVLSSGYAPTGIALDPMTAFALAIAKDADGRRLYPDMGFGQNITNFMGMNAAVSDTVSAGNEKVGGTGVMGIVGQFDAFRWGVQRQIAAHLIEFGDPDGLGDLQRMNQIALRAEIVYGIGIMDKKAFCQILNS